LANAMKYDLHSHTIFSDGEFSPEALINEASKGGVEVLAVTDHDTLDGLPRALKVAQGAGIDLVQGVEISTRWQKLDIHILGLGVNTQDPSLMAGLALHQSERIARAQQVSAKFEKLGIEGMWEEVSQQVKTHYVGRPDFARVLIKRGLVKDFQGAFHKYLAAGKPAYVATEWASVPEAVSWITSAGGVAVVAHPGRYKVTRTKLTKLLSCFKEAGGEGMEVLYSSQPPSQTKGLAALSKQFGLVASAGSDFHGYTYPGMRFGALGEMPSICQPLWDSPLWQKCID
ncbi:MAG: PHP domain-containing protein, partial [Gammaproteobacteria bacterium]|nr:PHP domain-containing protein [Gammaproteobacteria bacterium]